MNVYRVRIQIDEIDDDSEECLKSGTPYEAGRFDTEAKAAEFVEKELMIIRTVNVKLQKACRHVLDELDVGGEQSRAFAEEIQLLTDALRASAEVKAECPGCGAGSNEREFTGKDLLDAEAIHMRYVCTKCGSRIIEEFTLTDVFLDGSHAP